MNKIRQCVPNCSAILPTLPPLQEKEREREIDGAAASLSSAQISQIVLRNSISFTMDPSIPQNLDDYSPSSTTIKFDYPIPLLRGPIHAGPSENPSSGPYVLAFRNPQSWAAAYKTCESKIIEQCEGGARIGCAIAASDKCKPPWWHNLIGGKLPDLKEREMCEEREMEGCLAAAKEKCIWFAKDKCWRPFSEARIAAEEGTVSEKMVRKLVCLVSMPERSKWAGLIEFDESEFGITNHKASELLGSDPNYEWFFKQR